MDINRIADLANILKEYHLTKLDLTEGESHLILEATPAPIQQVATVMPAEPSDHVQTSHEAEKITEENDFYEQKTPLVGTVYLAPQTGADPYVSIGDHIGAGETICIVESMKMFNQIASDCSGIVEEICVSNGQIVEYGQTLFRIRED